METPTFEYATHDQIDRLIEIYAKELVLKERELGLEARRCEQASSSLTLKERELTLEEAKEARLAQELARRTKVAKAIFSEVGKAKGETEKK